MRKETARTKVQATYKLVGFYEDYNNLGKLRLRFVSSSRVLCCYIEDMKVINKYVAKADKEYISKLAQYQN